MDILKLHLNYLNQDSSLLESVANSRGKIRRNDSILENSSFKEKAKRNDVIPVTSASRKKDRSHADIDEHSSKRLKKNYLGLSLSACENTVMGVYVILL